MRLDPFTFDFIVNEEVKITSELLIELMESKEWHSYLKDHSIEMRSIK